MKPHRLPLIAAPVESDELIQVGDLSKESGKTIRAIHLYEELALLRPASRSKGGFRLYGSDARLRIRWISKLQELGFSLPEIQGIVRDWEEHDGAKDATNRIRALYETKLNETRAARKQLEVLERELETSVAYLATCGDVCEPDRLISSCTSCELHDHNNCQSGRSSKDIPELVLGFRAQSAHSTG